MPRSFYVNGHVLVDGLKMSKSLGNFLTLSGAFRLLRLLCLLDTPECVLTLVRRRRLRRHRSVLG